MIEITSSEAEKARLQAFVTTVQYTFEKATKGKKLKLLDYPEYVHL
jgi:hypothetical protein